LKTLYNKKIVLLFLGIIAVIIIVAYFCTIGSDNIINQTDPKSRISEFFGISIDENIISSEITLDFLHN